MSALRELNESIRPVAIHAEANNRARQFVQACRIRALHGENVMDARAYCEARGTLPEIKAAIASGTTTSLDAIAQIDPLAAAFLETMRHASAFDALLPSMKNVPFRTRVVCVTTGASGSIVAENTPKPISSLALTNNEMDQCKAVAITVMTKELLQLGGPAVMDLFERELRGALAVTTDREFIARITAGLTPIVSAGSSAANVRTDIKAAYAAVATNAQSKLFWLMDSGTAKALVAKETNAYDAAFPAMTPGGGVFAGVQVVVTDGISAADNTLILVDANGIAAASGPVEIASSGQAALQLDSVPTNPPTAATIPISLFQHNLTAIRVERYFGAERLGNSVALVSGVNY